MSATFEHERFRPHPFWRFTVGDRGSVIGSKGNRLRAFLDARGYLRVNAYEDGKWTQVGIHALVCETFHGPRPEGMHAAHTDGDSLNNSVSNVRWATPTENEADKQRHGRSLQGSRHHQAILNESTVRNVRARHEAGESQSAIARELQVNVSTINLIVNYRTWRHVS